MTDSSQSNAEVIQAEFRISVVSPSGIPEVLSPEIIFFGRSNVGKSTLLNKLCNRRGLAKTSKQPGRTQALNYFDLLVKVEGERRECTFVDAPGFGFAGVAKSTKKEWGKLMEAYLADVDRYRMALLLVDSRRELRDEEAWFIDNIDEERLFIVGTKADKLSQKEMSAARKRLSPQITFASSLKGTGVDKIRNAIAEAIN